MKWQYVRSSLKRSQNCFWWWGTKLGKVSEESLGHRPIGMRVSLAGSNFIVDVLGKIFFGNFNGFWSKYPLNGQKKLLILEFKVTPISWSGGFYYSQLWHGKIAASLGILHVEREWCCYWDQVVGFWFHWGREHSGLWTGDVGALNRYWKIASGC